MNSENDEMAMAVAESATSVAILAESRKAHMPLGGAPACFPDGGVDILRISA